MWMPSIASNFASQPRPVGQMRGTAWPASRSVLASCHTRRSKGDGRFSTSIRTRLGFMNDGDQRPRLEVAPFDVQRDEAAWPARIAAHPERRRGAGERRPVDRLEAVPCVLVARAVAFAVTRGAIGPYVEDTHYLIAARRKGSSRIRASGYGMRRPFT